jgi:murein DD-endopeptidase MepM/ murein hydrolase activator NlpD
MKHVSKRLSGLSRAAWMLLAGTFLGAAIFLATSFGPTGSTASRENSSQPAKSPVDTAATTRSTETPTPGTSPAITVGVPDDSSIEGAIHPDNVAADAPRPESLDFAPGAGSRRFVMPLASGAQVTDRYGAARGGGLVHGGIDLAVGGHQPVLASCSGRVATAYNGTYGNHVVIDCGEGWATLYAHLSEILVRDGQRVDQSAVVGLTGTTGYSTGEHLHFEIHYYGGRVNPEFYLDFKIPPGTPLSSGPLVFYIQPGSGTSGAGATATTEATATLEPSPTRVPPTPTHTPTITPTPTATPTVTNTPTPYPPTPTRTPTKAPVFIP